MEKLYAYVDETDQDTKGERGVLEATSSVPEEIMACVNAFVDAQIAHAGNDLP